jgi:uncharacterized protein
MILVVNNPGANPNRFLAQNLPNGSLWHLPTESCSHIFTFDILIVMSSAAQTISIVVNETQTVSGLLQMPAQAQACYVLAHGAGAGMQHPFMGAIANGLADRNIASLRYQFPYMERGAKRPDTPKLAQATVRAAVLEASRLAPNLPLFAGGKSFGGRMSSQAQALEPLPDVCGLIFLGFPLHPPGQPSDERAAHLFEVNVPMLFLQGERDDFANLDLLKGLHARLEKRATLRLFPDADHSFHVPARSGRKDSEVRTELLDSIADWVGTTLALG